MTNNVINTLREIEKAKIVAYVKTLLPYILCDLAIIFNVYLQQI